MLKFSGRTVLLSLFLAIGPGCTPEVGSEAWCEKMDETPKGEWTLEEVGDYAKHCVIRSGDDSG
jgi:hypothetical protein